ncbi:hypothetical protein BK142_31625 [Paenibacillus glucanolyticus]|jgi:spermidine synthase|nr:hypothetical protein BK142_31625 [Paenibacillus glucanolyticus]
MFLVSFVYMGLEMLASRIFTPYFGSSQYIWGSIISIFLVGSTIGYWVGGRAADTNKNRMILTVFLLAGAGSMAIIPFFAPYVLPVLNQLPQGIGILIASILLLLLPNIFLSGIVPVISKIVLNEGVSGKKIGHLHQIPAVGSIFGTLCTTFLVIPNFNVAFVICVYSVMILLSSFLIGKKGGINSMVISILILPVCFIPILGMAIHNKDQGLMYHTESIYNPISIVKLESVYGKKGNYLGMQFNKNSYQGIMDMDQPDEPLLKYTKSMIEIADYYMPDFDRGVVIGHGIGTIPQFYKDKNLISVELDSEVVELSKQFFGYNGDHVIVGDGRKVLGQQRDASFDLIFLDAYQDLTIPFHLTTREFVQEVLKKLTSDGIVILNYAGNQSDDLLGGIKSTFGTSFTHIRMFGTNDNKAGSQNIILVGSNKQLDPHEFRTCVEITVKDGKVITDANTHYNQLN